MSVGALVALAAPLRAQNEAVLRQAFEGKVVTVKIDMPATQQGVDVYPLDQMPVDFREVAQRLKDNSTALRIGQQVMVTKVVVKKNSHIEFQLGGGGYGTFGDKTSTDVSVGEPGRDEGREGAARLDQARAGSHETEAIREGAREPARGTRTRERARRSGGEAGAVGDRGEPAREARGERQPLQRALSERHSGRCADARTASCARWRSTSTSERRRESAASGSGGGVAGAAGQAFTGGGSRAAPTSIRKGLLFDEVETLLGPAATAQKRKKEHLPSSSGRIERTARRFPRAS